MEESINTQETEYGELPVVAHTEGFLYLYDLFNSVTSSKQLFTHKLIVLLQISRDINKVSFTRAEMEAMFPYYPKKALDSILNSLLGNQWFRREDGSLSYSLSKRGLLFIRFLPFLYKGNEMDEMAFQNAVNQIFKAAESMNLDIESTEFLRDQAMNGLQRSIEEIKSSLISKNPERIFETSKKMRDFLEVIKEFINRLKELNDKKRQKGIPFNESDRNSINILLATKSEIIKLLDVRKEYLMQASILGEAVFTLQDVERYLYKTDFILLSELIDPVGFVPANAKWVDENDIVRALDVFLSIRKRMKNREISQKVKGYRDEDEDQGQEPYLNRVEAEISNLLSQTNELSLSTLLSPQKSKVDALMYLASVCYLEGKQVHSSEHEVIQFTLDISLDAEIYQGQMFTTLSKGSIKRRDI